MKFHHLAIEGPIGVGKTSLVKRLAQKFDAHVVMENVENPFLKEFYEERQGAAFQAQLFFLLNRYQQQVELAQRLAAVLRPTKRHEQIERLVVRQPHDLGEGERPGLG